MSEVSQHRFERLNAFTGVRVCAVGLGSADAGAEFSTITGWPAADLYADPTSASYLAMGFSRGALPDSNVSGYAKLLLMLAGIEAPGTMRVRPFELQFSLSA